MPDHPLSLRNCSRRSFLSASAFAAGATLLPHPDAWADLPMPSPSSPLEHNLDAYLDAYLAAYLPAMNAPGLTLGLTDAASTRRVSCYGYADLERRLPVTPNHLFQIGSITKSFVALVTLQLHEEGMLDLDKPILDYLPHLPIVAEFGPISVHHLLTHTSGLPDNLTLFAPDPTARLVQGFTPGRHFHYCNAGFDILGLLAVHLDGRPWRTLLPARILNPLGMTRTTPVITTALRDRFAIGYEPFRDDQQYPRQGRLAPAPNLVMDDTAGCIASTPADMAVYARMLLNRGQLPKSQAPGGHIVSEESFARMATPYIKAPEFSPTAGYGYGIAVDTLDGHRILRHTGGMVAFASSIHVDLDGGVAAFASINAMQGYRPIAVTEYAVRLLRADRESKPLPAAPPLSDPRDIDNAADYAGTFTAPDGRALLFAAQGNHLTLVDPQNPGQPSIVLQKNDSDKFISTVPGALAGNTFIFGRKSGPAPSSAKSAPQPVVEVSYGADWYAAPAYDGPRTFSVPPDYPLYEGRYWSDSAWGGEALVYILKGQLRTSGNELIPLGDGLFRIGDQPWMPDTVQFLNVFEGKARNARFAGLDFQRVDVG
ncbi:MAG TPA: serine hydrolase domain-containing protein [Acidobacteriaceae bacterium]|jgi:CubicO group peptidase (beta-lactamase class C family)|nr:serine hydrolase domain-containing protein [Acidobacteriaceae bacterium]